MSMKRPTAKQQQLLGAIFGVEPTSINAASVLTAAFLPESANKLTVELDGDEQVLIQQYRRLREPARHVLRGHANRLVEVFAERPPAPLGRINAEGAA